MNTRNIFVIDRRTLLIGAGVAGGLFSAGGALIVPRGDLLADGANNPASGAFKAALDEIIGSGKPIEGKIKLTLPDIFENGNTVPFTIAVESPMSEASYVKEITILSTGNPVVRIATFHLGPWSGEAIVSGRLRLARSQDVYVLGVLNDASVLLAKQFVKVTIGGCGA